MEFRIISPCHETFNCEYRGEDKDLCVQCNNCAALKAFQKVLQSQLAESMVCQDNSLSFDFRETIRTEGPEAEAAAVIALFAEEEAVDELVAPEGYGDYLDRVVKEAA